jgi:HlyD family secretion protein
MIRRVCLLTLLTLSSAACHRQQTTAGARASGYVEATDVRLASKVPGRVATVTVREGARVAEGQTVVTLATTETDLALERARAQRAGAEAQVRLLQAGARAEDVRQAQAQVAAAEADARAADADLAAAKTDETRFQTLVDKRAGSAKQRDDAVARRELAEARVKGASDRASAAAAALARVQAGARPEELDAARAKVAEADAAIAALNQQRADATIVSPLSGIVTSRLVEPGELVAVGAPLLVVIDLDHAWVNAYVEEPLVPSLRVEQPASVTTDGGQRLQGRITFISPQAEFTPRNVQTSAERAKLVYRVKVTVDNHEGVLKPGMPVEVDLSAEGGR